MFVHYINFELFLLFIKFSKRFQTYIIRKKLFLINDKGTTSTYRENLLQEELSSVDDDRANCRPFYIVMNVTDII